MENEKPLRPCRTSAEKHSALRWPWTIRDGKGGDAAVWLFGILQLNLSIANGVDHVPSRYASAYGITWVLVLVACVVVWCAVFVTRDDSA